MIQNFNTNSQSTAPKILDRALTFDDVLLVPQYSEVLPDEVDISSSLSKSCTLSAPIISAAMDTVTDGRFALEMSNLGGLGIIHKNLTPKEQASEVLFAKKHSKGASIIGAAVGVTQIDLNQRVPALIEAGVDVLVVDTAHGHTKSVLDSVSQIKTKYGDSIVLIAGNIATKKAALALVQSGVDGVKVGIGPGSICTTRIVAGIGVPQITAIMDVSEALAHTNTMIIADGGIKYSGDIVKALAAGAHTVMIGSLFAGTEESPGELITYQERLYKKYRGMGSLGAMQKGSKDRYFQAQQTDHSKLVPEGIEGQVPYKGPLYNMFHQLLGGLRAGMGYVGAHSINELHKKAEFVKITASGLRESHVHDVYITSEAPNYSTPKL